MGAQQRGAGGLQRPLFSAGASGCPSASASCFSCCPAGMVVCNWVVILSVCITVLCVFDPTGRTFVKLRATKRRQRNLRTYNLR